MPFHHTVLMLTAVLIAMITPWVATASPPVKAPTASLLVSGLQGATGSIGWSRRGPLCHRGAHRDDLARRPEDEARSRHSRPDFQLGSGESAVPWTSRSSAIRPTCS